MSTKSSSSVSVSLVPWALIAAALSYHTNHSIGWMVLHFFCGAIYCIYWLVEYANIFARLGL